MNDFTLRRAQLSDVQVLAPLFDAYRRFYEQPGDLALAHAYVHARLERGEATVLLALAQEHAGADDSRAVPLGFCLLYPSWCSVAAAPIFVLSDLFVADTARRRGVGRALMQAACEAGRATSAIRLDLTTAHTNTRAQSLYESLGWRRDEVFRTYSLALLTPGAVASPTRSPA